MKMRPDDFAQLRDLIEPIRAKFDAHYGDARAAYADRDPRVPRIDKARDTDMRYRWDMLYATGQPGRDLMTRLYDYLNDSHIDTALRALTQE